MDQPLNSGRGALIELDDAIGIAVASPVGPVSMRMLPTDQEHHDYPPQIEALGTAGRSYLWTQPDLKARLSIFPFDAALDPNVWVRLVTSWAFLWEFDASGPCPDIALTMSFDDPPASATSGPDCGQAFIAVNMCTEAWEVIIGGPDEEQLVADAMADLVPDHWQPGLESLMDTTNAELRAAILPGNRGLQWNLPAMHPADRCLFGTNLCWSPSRSPAETDDESPWYAALTTTRSHLQHRETYSSR